MHILHTYKWAPCNVTRPYHCLPPYLLKARCNWPTNWVCWCPSSDRTGACCNHLPCPVPMRKIGKSCFPGIYQCCKTTLQLMWPLWSHFFMQQWTIWRGRLGKIAYIAWLGQQSVPVEIQSMTYSDIVYLVTEYVNTIWWLNISKQDIWTIPMQLFWAIIPPFQCILGFFCCPTFTFCHIFFHKTLCFLQGGNKRYTYNKLYTYNKSHKSVCQTQRCDPHLPCMMAPDFVLVLVPTARDWDQVGKWAATMVLIGW